MAIEKTIELNVDSKGAQADFGKLADAIKELNSTFSKFSKDTTDGLEDVKDGAEKTSKGVGKIGNTLNNLAKGTGVIFLISKAFEVFKSIAEKNQKVLDVFNTTFEVLSIAFNDFFNFIFDNSSGVIDTFKAIFKDPAQAIKDLGKTIYDGVVVRFQEFIEVLGLAGKAIGQLVTGQFSAAFETIKEAGRQTIDVVTGVDDSFDSTIDTIKNYASETIKAAKENVNLANSAELAAAQQTLLVEKYDRQAEQLRQIRDEERNSISERKKANDELLLVLEQQEKSMLATADAQLKSAQAEASKNNSIENQVAVTEALANRLGVLAQIEGFRSEQKANDLALDREQIELTNSKAESESKLSIERKRFNAEQIEDELARLEALREIDLLEAEQESLRLQAIVDNSNAETQAKIDAQITLDEFNEQSRQTNLERDKQIADSEIALEQQKTAAKRKALDDAISLAGAETGVGKALLIVKQGLALKEMIMEAKKTITFSKLAVAKSTVAAAEGTAQTAKIGFPQNIPMLIGYAAQAVGIIGAIRSATSSANSISSSFGGGGGASVPAAPPSVPTASSIPPSFNVVGASETSVLADTVAEQTNEPIQAYVVSNDITTAQSLENNIVEGATI